MLDGKSGGERGVELAAAQAVNEAAEAAALDGDGDAGVGGLKAAQDLALARADHLAGQKSERQMAAHVMLLVAQREPELLSEFIPDLIDALYRPEAQTRWEILDALTLLVLEHAKEIGAAFDGAEAALFDDLSSILHFSAFRLLATWGATERGRSRKVWPILDEAIQCYHGDVEFNDMLNAVAEFATGKLSEHVKEALVERMSFDAHNGRGALKRKAQTIIDNVQGQ